MLSYEKLSKDNPTVKPTPELVKNIYIPRFTLSRFSCSHRGEPHWVLVYDVGRSRYIYFTETVADFNKEELEVALGNFAKTERRLVRNHN